MKRREQHQWEKTADRVRALLKAQLRPQEDEAREEPSRSPLQSHRHRQIRHRYRHRQSQRLRVSPPRCKPCYVWDYDTLRGDECSPRSLWFYTLGVAFVIDRDGPWVVDVVKPEQIDIRVTSRQWAHYTGLPLEKAWSVRSTMTVKTQAQARPKAGSVSSRPDVDLDGSEDGQVDDDGDAATGDDGDAVGGEDDEDDDDAATGADDSSNYCSSRAILKPHQVLRRMWKEFIDNVLQDSEILVLSEEASKDGGRRGRYEQIVSLCINAPDVELSESTT